MIASSISRVGDYTITATGDIPANAEIQVVEIPAETAKKLTNKELLTLLKKEGFEVRSHSSTLEEDDADLIRKSVLNERKQAQEQARTAAKPASVLPIPPVPTSLIIL